MGHLPVSDGALQLADERTGDTARFGTQLKVRYVLQGMLKLVASVALSQRSGVHILRLYQASLKLIE